MKKYFVYVSLATTLLTTGFLQSCKSKNKSTENTTTTNTATDTNTAATTTPPPVVASDDELKTGVADATKDFPGVTANVNNGEVTLTGNITRDKLPILMQAINSLHPKKVNNQLTIK